jgi:hypothetical protein
MNFICIAPSVTSYVLPLQEPHKLPFRNLYKIKALVKPITNNQSETRNKQEITDEEEEEETVGSLVR